MLTTEEKAAARACTFLAIPPNPERPGGVAVWGIVKGKQHLL